MAIGLVLGRTGGGHGWLRRGCDRVQNKKNYAGAAGDRPLARAGNADAQHLLGLMYYMGRGVTQDYKQALEWHLQGGASKARPTPSTWSGPCITPATP